MGERRSARGIHRTDDQILNHTEDVDLLRAVAAGQVTTQPALRMDLRRLARDELLLAGFGTGTTPILLPRGQRIVDVANGMLARPVE